MNFAHLNTDHEVEENCYVAERGDTILGNPWWTRVIEEDEGPDEFTAHRKCRISASSAGPDGSFWHSTKYAEHLPAVVDANTGWSGMAGPPSGSLGEYLFARHHRAIYRTSAKPDTNRHRALHSWKKVLSARCSAGTSDEVILRSSQASVRDQIQSAITQVKDGWLGPDSQGAAAGAIADMSATLEAVSNKVQMPELEIDDSSGAITLTWGNPRESFSLTFTGSGHAIGVLSQPGTKTNYPAWRISANDHASISKRLSDSRIAILMGAYDLFAVSV